MSAQLISSATAYPPSPELMPQEALIEGRYEVRFAKSEEELDELLRLRFEVFNIELKEGLEESFETGRDRDEFDAVCHHLIVVEQTTGEIVGTYRMQTSCMARGGCGYYSAAEFDLSPLPSSVVDNAVEVGRACVALGHRNTQVLYLLWRGLALYMAGNQRRYLFGCCSLTSQDPDEGRAVMAYLERHNHLHPALNVIPQAGFECYDDSSALDLSRYNPIKLPKLFRTYLRHGAKVCGPPAIDRCFKTIDYLVIFDVAAMDERRYRTFFG
jgi:putative hemolysin